MLSGGNDYMLVGQGTSSFWNCVVMEAGRTFRWHLVSYLFRSFSRKRIATRDLTRLMREHSLDCSTHAMLLLFIATKACYAAADARCQGRSIWVYRVVGPDDLANQDLRVKYIIVSGLLMR